MKKAIYMILTLLLCTVLAACGDAVSLQSPNAGVTPDTPKDLQKNADGLYELYTADDLVRYREILEEEMQTSYKKSVDSGFPTPDSGCATSGAILMADIDMSTVCSEALGSWRPIGSGLTVDACTTCALLSSLFDGNGHTISGLYISGDWGGLFGYLADTEVRDLTFTNTYVSAESSSAAVLAAQTMGGTFRNICIESDVEVQLRASDKEAFMRYGGGIVASTFEAFGGTTFENCVNRGKVTTDDSDKCYIGGIVGYADGPVKLIRCENYGEISSTGTEAAKYPTCAGGIVGYSGEENMYGSSIKGCVNYGTIQGGNGIAGESETSIEFCVNAGTINGGTAIAGPRTKEYDCLHAGTIIGDDSSFKGNSVPAGDPSLTDGSLVAQLNALAEGEYWVQGDNFPVWSGLE